MLSALSPLLLVVQVEVHGGNRASRRYVVRKGSTSGSSRQTLRRASLEISNLEITEVYFSEIRDYSCYRGKLQ